MARKVLVEDLVTGADIARRLGLSRQRIAQLVESNKTFPAPIGDLGKYVLWNWPDVEQWARDTGRIT